MKSLFLNIYMIFDLNLNDIELDGHECMRCKPFIPSRHIHSIIKHLVYYTTLGIVKINIFEHFEKYLNSTNIFLETDNNFTQ